MLSAVGCRDIASTPADRETSRILFADIDSVTKSGTLVSIAPDGSDRETLPGASGNEVTPYPSPDGRQVAFVGATPLRPLVPQVFMRARDGGQSRQLTNATAGATAPSWTPDGRVMYFNRDDVKAWVVSPDGTGARAVSAEPWDEFTPVMSPDGRRIAFGTGRHSANGYLVFELYAMNADGTGQVRLTTTRSATRGFNLYPAWSPDSRHIAFVRWVDAEKARIWIVDADGSNPRQLVPNADPAMSDRYVSWSPDGRRIAVERTIDGRGDVFVANADGTGMRDITNTPARIEQSPRWGIAP